MYGLDLGGVRTCEGWVGFWRFVRTLGRLKGGLRRDIS